MKTPLKTKKFSVFVSLGVVNAEMRGPLTIDEALRAEALLKTACDGARGLRIAPKAVKGSATMGALEQMWTDDKASAWREG